MENIRYFFDELSDLLYHKENYFENEDGFRVSNIDYTSESGCEQRMLKKLYAMDQATRGIKNYSDAGEDTTLSGAYFF